MLKDMFTYLAFYVLIVSSANVTGNTQYVYLLLQYGIVGNIAHYNDTVFVGAGWRRGIVVSAGSCSLRFTSAARLGVLWWRTSRWYEIRSTICDIPSLAHPPTHHHPPL